MPRVCTVCNHPERTAIEAAVISGVSYRVISSQYGIGNNAIQRHVAAHVRESVEQSQVAVEEARGLDVVKQLKDINEISRAILKEARDDKDNDTALKAIDRISKQLELQAKLLGDIDKPVAVYLSSEWLDIRKALVRALSPFPDARIAVASVLAQMEDAHARLN